MSNPGEFRRAPSSRSRVNRVRSRVRARRTGVNPVSLASASADRLWRHQRAREPSTSRRIRSSRVDRPPKAPSHGGGRGCRTALERPTSLDTWTLHGPPACAYTAISPGMSALPATGHAAKPIVSTRVAGGVSPARAYFLGWHVPQLRPLTYVDLVVASSCPVRIPGLAWRRRRPRRRDARMPGVACYGPTNVAVTLTASAGASNVHVGDVWFWQTPAQ